MLESHASYIDDASSRFLSFLFLFLGNLLSSNSLLIPTLVWGIAYGLLIGIIETLQPIVTFPLDETLTM